LARESGLLLKGWQMERSERGGERRRVEKGSGKSWFGALMEVE
jgi:hypothetical protein